MKKAESNFDSAFLLEQMTGIEPAYSAWEADTLPLSYICKYKLPSFGMLIL